MFASPEGRADVGKSGRIRATSRTRRRTELTTAPDIRFDTPPKDGEPVATGALGLLRMPRVVLFGEGQRHAVGQVVAGLGGAALICTDSRLAASTELSGIVSSLEDAGVTVHVFADTEAELPVTCIIRCLAGLPWSRPTRRSVGCRRPGSPRSASSWANRCSPTASQ